LDEQKIAGLFSTFKSKLVNDSSHFLSQCLIYRWTFSALVHLQNFANLQAPPPAYPVISLHFHSKLFFSIEQDPLLLFSLARQHRRFSTHQPAYVELLGFLNSESNDRLRFEHANPSLARLSQPHVVS
jgi:hypothetical protein